MRVSLLVDSIMSWTGTELLVADVVHDPTMPCSAFVMHVMLMSTRVAWTWLDNNNNNTIIINAVMSTRCMQHVHNKESIKAV